MNYNPRNELNAGDRLLRLKQIIKPDGPLPIGRTNWLQGVQEGRFPQPIRLGKKTVCWRESDILKLMREGV